MERPKKFEGFVQISISVPENHIELAKIMGINISEICRHALAVAVNDKESLEQHKKKEKVKKKALNVPRPLLNNLINTAINHPLMLGSCV